MEIKLENLSFSYGSTPIFKDINLVIDKPELVCILGPNGAGKSTLMHCMNKLQTPTSGTVYLGGKDLASYSLKELAKLVSFVPHSEDTTFSMTVLDTVLMGRMPHTGTIMSQEDVLIAAENIKLLGMQDFAMHGFDELSAGQHQKVMIARSLTQEPKVMLLDEPTANLDVKFQMLVMRLLRDVARLKGITVVTICHDLNVTSMYADRVVMLYDHRIYADGTPKEVLTVDNIRTLYGIECQIIDIQGRPHIALLDGDELDSHLEDNMARRSPGTDGGKLD
ncbi:MAG: ABC transporter ATP-binding protein [Candidatus Methanomethylophilaceae archaeon]|nr:ABC transporter ATP-binding protein [Candidatus Methanomethylophilaceae archaeon]